MRVADAGGRGNNRQGALAEISYDSKIVSVWIPKRIQIWYGRQNMVVEIHKTLCGGRNTEKLINPRCFNLKFSQVRMFLILVKSAYFAMTIVQN